MGASARPPLGGVHGGLVLLLGAALAWPAAFTAAQPLPPLELPPAEPAAPAVRAIEQPAETQAREVPAEQCAPVEVLPPADCPVPDGPPELPDSFSAGSAELGPEGLISASGGVELRITSVLEDGVLLCRSETGEYSSETGEARLAGAVTLQLEGSGLLLHCTALEFDPLLGRLSVEGLEIGLPFDAIVPLDRLPQDEPHTGGHSHFFSPTPQAVYLKADRLRVERSAARSEYVLSGVRLTHSPRPDPDLYVTAAEARLEPGQRVVFKDVALVVSGFQVLSWPRVSRGLVKEHRLYGFGIPKLRFDNDIGVGWAQPFRLDAEMLKADGILDYSPEYGLRSWAFAYTEPAPGLKLGVAAGVKSSVDVRLRDVRRRDFATLTYEQSLPSPLPGVSRARFSAEYGEIAAYTDPLPGAQLPGVYAFDGRFAASAGVDFTPLLLAGELYLTGAGRAAYYDYRDAGEQYEVFGGSAGLIYHQPGFDNYVLYSLNSASGRPVFSFDEVRERELDFAASLRLHPEWRHVVRGIYDVDRDEFDQLEVGAMKRQRSYEVGMYWDFARESAGVELGLLMD